jgi:ribosome maturation factor RimP
VGRPIPGVEAEVEVRVEALGFEFVEMEWGGAESRPILRLRIDLPDSSPGKGITVDHCVQVSRALEPWLDEHPGVPERYTLEVSSPGVERPLTRRRDFERFQGSEVVVKTSVLAQGARSRRIQGVLDGVEEGDPPRVRLRPPRGEVIVVPLDQVEKSHLVYRWAEEK